MNTTTTVTQTLRAAAAHLEATGWSRFDETANGGPPSLIGALVDMSGCSVTEARMSPEFTAAYMALQDAVEALTGDECSPVLWSEAPGRLEGDVLTMLRSVAMAEEMK